MCLTIKSIKHSYKLENVNGEKLIPVWKVIKKDNYSMKLGSAFTQHWTEGWNFSNRTDPLNVPSYIRANKVFFSSSHNDPLNEYEKRRNKVFFGFHFCLSKKDAEQYKIMVQDADELRNILERGVSESKESNERGLKVVKMYVNKKHVVAKGTAYFEETDTKSLVASQAYWKGE